MGLIDLNDITADTPEVKTHTSTNVSVQASLVAEARRQAIDETLAGLSNTEAVIFTTKGTWSMHHLAEAIIYRAGMESQMWFTTYNLTRDPAETFARLKREGYLHSIAALLDHRMMGAENSAFGVLQGIADRIGLGNVHAKILVVKGFHDTYAVIGSANFTNNRRLEAGTIFRNAPAIDSLIDYLDIEIDCTTD